MSNNTYFMLSVLTKAESNFKSGFNTALLFTERCALFRNLQYQFHQTRKI